MLIKVPNGIIVYGGVGVESFRSADGVLYTVYCGERPGRLFGTHIFRELVSGALEWVEYAPFCEGRVGVTVEPDGMYLHYAVSRERQIVRVKVAGFVTPSFPGGTNFPPPSPIIVSGEDRGARDGIAALRLEARDNDTRIRKDLEKRIAALEALLKQAGVTTKQVEEIAWAKSADRLYSELSNPNSPVSNLIREIATGKR